MVAACKWSLRQVSLYDRKLALHIKNAKEYPRCCLPVISLLRTALAHACIPSLMRTTRVELASTHIRMWIGFNLGSTRIHRKRVQCGHVQPELNPGSSCSADVPQETVDSYTHSIRSLIYLFEPSVAPQMQVCSLLVASRLVILA